MRGYYDRGENVVSLGTNMDIIYLSARSPSKRGGEWVKLVDRYVSQLQD